MWGGAPSDEVLAEYADPDSTRYQNMIDGICDKLGFTSLRYHRLDDLITARINTACNLLTSTNTPISQIAEQLGYANFTHFIRQFKAHTGLSPSAFRAKRNLS